jgi:hypothetical protein
MKILCCPLMVMALVFLLVTGCSDSPDESSCTQSQLQKLFTEDAALPEATLHINKIFDARRTLESCPNSAYVKNYLALAYLRSAMYLDLASPQELNRVTQLIGSRTPSNLEGKRETLVVLAQQQLQMILGMTPLIDTSGPLEPFPSSLTSAAENNLIMSKLVSRGLKSNKFAGVTLSNAYPGDLSDIAPKVPDRR